MRRRLTPKRLAFVILLSLLVILGAMGGLTMGRVVSMRQPPGGKLVASHGGYRLYVVPGNDVQTLRTLKDWAAKWGDRTQSNYSGYGGSLALITVESQGAIVIDEKRYPVPKGHFQVCVHDEKFTWATAWERFKQVLTGRL